jgi:hypothetical protein
MSDKASLLLTLAGAVVAVAFGLFVLERPLPIVLLIVGAPTLALTGALLFKIHGTKKSRE